MEPFNQPWSEIKAMSQLERKSILYTAYKMRGHEIDWSTGRIKPLKTK